MKKKFLFGLLAGTLVLLFLGVGPNAATAAPEKIALGFVTIWNMAWLYLSHRVPSSLSME